MLSAAALQFWHTQVHLVLQPAVPLCVQARNSRQDQIHNSIVSTLLALMDGLDSRGQVVIIGATNRIDSLDSALRRPGRSVTVGCRFLMPHCRAISEQSALRCCTDTVQQPDR